MPVARRRLRRAARVCCFGAAVSLAAAGVVTSPAGASSTPNFTYSSSVGAIGMQVAMLSNPEPSQVPDLTDVQTPSSDGQLDSFGTSEANGHVGNLNGLGAFPSLICLASSQFCNAIPIGTLSGGAIKSFPPPDPLDAHAVYPAHPHDSAPTIGTQAASLQVKQGPMRLGSGASQATVTSTSTSTSAVDSGLKVVGAVSIGSLQTTTKQTATSSTLTTVATATAGNIDIGTKGLLHIGSVRSSLSITSQPGKAPVDHASSVVSDVSVMGQPATIDHSGVHVKASQGVSKGATQAYQAAIDAIFNKAGFKIRQATITHAATHSGQAVTVNGLEMFFKHQVKGVPQLTIGLPPGVPCPIEPITSQLPIDPCSGLGIQLNAKYRGQIALANLEAVSLAKPPAKQPSIKGGGGPQPSGGNGVGPAGGSGSGGISGGSGGGAGGGLTSTSGSGSGSDQAPVVAGQAQHVADPLGDLGDRLWWFFPLIALTLFAIAGRLGFPARLPSGSR